MSVEDKLRELQELMTSDLDAKYQSLVAMLEDGTLTDVTLECDDGVTIPCHRVVLAAGSTVFKYLFSCNESSEGASGNFKIEDFSSDVIKQVIAYLYNDFDKLATLASQDNLSPLLWAGVRYNISGLISICELFMIPGLTTDNAAEFLTDSYSYRLPRLKRAATKFITENFVEVKKTQPWKDFTDNYPEAVLDILSFACKKK